MASKDINTVAYDAPLSVSEPYWLWKQLQNIKAMSMTNLTLPAVDLTGKWVLVSGGNSGIGREACLQFAAWGANIVMACREPPSHEIHPKKAVEQCVRAAEDAGHKKSMIEWWEVDFTKLATVEALATRWLDTGRPLDILCNNAGLGTNATATGKAFITEDGFELLHQVNFLAHVLLTLRLLPAIAKAEEPRIVCTTSCAIFMGDFDLREFNTPTVRTHIYSNNKLWFQTWIGELQRRLLQHDHYKHITVNGVHPGYVFSSIFRKFMPGDGLSDRLTNAMVYQVTSRLFITEQQGSLAILNAATSSEAGPDPRIQGVGNPDGKGGGRWFNRIWEGQSMPHTSNADCRMRVWRKVNDELKLDDKGLLDVLGLYYTDTQLSRL